MFKKIQDIVGLSTGFDNAMLALLHFVSILRIPVTSHRASFSFIHSQEVCAPSLYGRAARKHYQCKMSKMLVVAYREVPAISSRRKNCIYWFIMHRGLAEVVKQFCTVLHVRRFLPFQLRTSKNHYFI